MKSKSKRRRYLPKRKSTQTPWKVEKLKDAESLEEITREGLSCSICMDYFSIPQATPCGHVFCYSCLFKWLEAEDCCPQCRNCIDCAPYPVFILTNQVEQALVKFPDSTVQTRLVKDLQNYKALENPWGEMFPPTITDDMIYGSSSDSIPDHPLFNTWNINHYSDQTDSDLVIGHVRSIESSSDSDGSDSSDGSDNSDQDTPAQDNTNQSLGNVNTQDRGSTVTVNVLDRSPLNDQNDSSSSSSVPQIIIRRSRRQRRARNDF